MHKSDSFSHGDPPNRAIILAAGRGRRLRPHTDHTPKPLLEVRGQPILAHCLTALAQAGVNDVCIVVGHLGEKIMTFAGDGHAWSLQISYVWQRRLLGTAHALRTARPFLTAPTFVMAADYALREGHLLDLKTAYQQSGAEIAVSLKELASEELSERSSVEYDARGRISRIVEKPAPEAAPSRVGASLIYIVPAAIADYLNDLSLSSRQEYEIADVVNEMIADDFTITGLLQPRPEEWHPR